MAISDDSARLQRHGRLPRELELPSHAARRRRKGAPSIAMAMFERRCDIAGPFGVQQDRAFRPCIVDARDRRQWPVLDFDHTREILRVIPVRRDHQSDGLPDKARPISGKKSGQAIANAGGANSARSTVDH
jgi:hypothetical protein